MASSKHPRNTDPASHQTDGDRAFDSAALGLAHSGPLEGPIEPAYPVPSYGVRPIHRPGPVIPATTIEFPEPAVDPEDPAMGHSSTVRQDIARARRLVVKIGSSSLTDEDGLVNPDRIDIIADALEARMDRGTDLIVVSSGAVACGMGPLELSQRPTDLATKQAAASVGQVLLAQEWARSFARYGRTIGQVLLTASDAGRRDRARNAQRTIDRLRQLGAVPIVNENDTVATSEMRFGDNDRLAALVSHLAFADALVLLSDVDGLYDRNPAEPDANFIPEVRGAKDLRGVVAGDGGRLGTGGMAAKVSAARLASRAGVPVLLTSTENVGAALDAANVGTAFWPQEDRLSAWKFWVLYAASSEGRLHLDAGAVEAVTRKHRSLLPVGITAIEGKFTQGKIVDIVDPEGKLVGRGEVNYDSEMLEGMIGKSTADLPDIAKRPAVHTDYLSTYSNRHRL
ncbi:glutamate 5-kinase [Corynebacterium heidelbergense]|uniref:Glutamate 5-kinase n=1 Tax=Corynebacterium heidelbergense TaxID=2055947 RepID=A0A364VAP7_9CORY|nr:glutamate 5-kinase [Corynebacterium heidelbergense]RAV33009.1 glutamate 5-kinase [Corynebacterium heidelbergense]RAV33691.1 glutamate 5-kinase [Corynebacterium heidelbergense]WCZ36219.1 Glutamate 5-kinase [Corynebacterium heidelbergense]